MTSHRPLVLLSSDGRAESFPPPGKVSLFERANVQDLDSNSINNIENSSGRIENSSAFNGIPTPLNKQSSLTATAESLESAYSTALAVSHDPFAAAEAYSGAAAAAAASASTVADANWFKAEAATWKLASALYADRTHPDAAQVYDSMLPASLATSLVSQADIAGALLTRNHALRQAHIVLAWLEDEALESASYSVDPVPVPVATLATLKGSLRGSRPPRMVSALDPDAQLRQSRTLAQDDEAAARRVDRSIWALIRAGRLDDARALARQIGQSWRAVSLGGAGFAPDHASAVTLRAAWRASCRALALATPNTAPFAAATYAVLGGLPDVAAPVCSSWSDLLWLHTRTAVDAALDTALLAGSPPVSAAETVGSGLPPQTEPFRSLEELFERVHTSKASGSGAVSQETPADELWHSVQQSLVLDKLQYLLNTLWEAGEAPGAPSGLPRFAAHLALWASQLPGGSVAIAGEGERLVRRYVDGLVKTHRPANLVAAYAAQLPAGSAQVEAYAPLLRSAEDRSAALEAAEAAGLDVPALTRAIASDDVSWLCYDPGQALEALAAANDRARGLMAAHDVQGLTRLVSNTVPSSTVEAAMGQVEDVDTDPVLREWSAWSVLVRAHVQFSSWKEQRAAQPIKPPAPRREGGVGAAAVVAAERAMVAWEEAHAAWSSASERASARTLEALYGVLSFPGGWAPESARPSVIPDVFFLTMHVLQAIGRGTEAVALVDVLMEETVGLYKAFDGATLRRFAAQLADAGVSCLRTGEMDSLGYTDAS